MTSAASDSACATTSRSMWPASESSASECESKPPTTSATRMMVVATSFRARRPRSDFRLCPCAVVMIGMVVKMHYTCSEAWASAESTSAITCSSLIE